MNNDFDKYPVTYGLMALCVVVYCFTTIKYGLTMSVSDGIKMGGYNPILVWEYHEYYRLITANFIHFGIMHIVVNMYSLHGLGCFMERVMGRVNYLIMIIVSALSTTCIPLAIYLIKPGFEANVIAGGASGIIFGVIGALAAYAYLYQDVFGRIFESLLPNLLMMVVISFLVPSISLSAHVSGFVGGFIVSYILLQAKLRKSQRDYYIN
ncbi:MAG: rhomboid family intramembrane serine protease [Erysipelotrichaceae bacterium]|nr:rhomboid family intramembrane serine protease [Erysipelotrichaceae bacterium]